MENGTWYFASAATQGSGGRWDLAAPDGTCYFADTEAGALMEAVGADYTITHFVTQERLNGLRLSEAWVSRSTATADLRSDQVSAYGVTSELCAASPYTLTQQWAAAFKSAGFGGITYGLRFLPNRVGLGLFGPSGPDESRLVGPPQSVMATATDLGLVVEATPALGNMQMLE